MLNEVSNWQIGNKLASLHELTKTKHNTDGLFLLRDRKRDPQ